MHWGLGFPGSSVSAIFRGIAKVGCIYVCKGLRQCLDAMATQEMTPAAAAAVNGPQPQLLHSVFSPLSLLPPPSGSQLPWRTESHLSICAGFIRCLRLLTVLLSLMRVLNCLTA